jgi:hypothetical protein
MAWKKTAITVAADYSLVNCQTTAMPLSDSKL